MLSETGDIFLGLFSFFQHAPYQKEIEDSQLVKKQYRYWRLRIFYSMYIGYAFFYLTRKSFTFAMPAMIVSLGFTKADLGILGSVLYITYGLSKFISGVISDRSNPRYFMACGLVLTGICNICFGLSSSIVLFAIFWGLNGWFQGFGWPPCARLLTHWYSQEERGRWWSVWSTSHNVGGAMIPLIVAVLAQFWGWRVAMFIPGSMCILVGLFLVNRLRDTPQSLGLPSIEVFKNGTYARTEAGIPGQGGALQERELSRKEILVDYVLKNRYIWTLGFAYFFVYVIRTAVNDWGQLFLYEEKGFSLIAAGSCIFGFEVGGFFGSLAAGWISDTVFKGRRGPVNALFSLGGVFVCLSLWYIPVGGFAIASASMFAIGFLIFGPQMLIGVAAADLSHKKAAGTSTGFVGWFAYSGAAAAGYPFGKITQEWGWEFFFIVLIACGVISSLLLFPLWSARSGPKKPASQKVRADIGKEAPLEKEEVETGV